MKALKIAGVVFAIIIVGISGLWWACSPHQPSDTKLERQFERHRSDLDRLVQMMDQDWRMSRIAPDFTWRQDTVAWPRPESEWGISKQRWDEYRSIFARSGFKDGVTRREKSSDVIVDVWSWGIVPAGTYVGYLHCGPPTRGYSHTEQPCIEDRSVGNGDGYRYKKIAQDWYIYQESN